MSIKKRSFGGSVLSAVVVAAVISVVPVHASDTGAFVGGMLAGKVMRNMHSRTEAEQQQAYYAQQQAQQQQVQQVQQAPQAAPASSSQSTEQKLDELNKLAAGGYITPEEYTGTPFNISRVAGAGTGIVPC